MILTNYIVISSIRVLITMHKAMCTTQGCNNNIIKKKEEEEEEKKLYTLMTFS